MKPLVVVIVTKKNSINCPFNSSDCGCGNGAINSTCSNTGTCFCLDRVTGLKCNQCFSFYHNLQSLVGCQRCSSCEISLHEEILSSSSLLSQANSSIVIFQQQLLADKSLDELVNSILLQSMSRPNDLINELNYIEQNLRHLNETNFQNTLTVAQETMDKVLYM